MIEARFRAVASHEHQMFSEIDLHSPVASLLLIAVLLGLSGLFAASEVGLLTLGRLRARQLADEGSRPARVVLRLLDDPGRLLSTLLISITSLLYASETLITVTSLDRGWGFWVPVIVAPLFVIIFVEVTPVLYASRHPQRVSLTTAPLVRLAAFVLYPLVVVITRITHSIVHLVGGMPAAGEPSMTEEEIKTAIVVAEEQGLLDPEERDMLHGALEFTDKAVKQVMVPRLEIDAVPAQATLDEVMQVIFREKHSRVPVYRDTIDDIIGVIYAKDITPYLRRGERQVLAEQVARAPYFIPETKKVDDLLEELQQNRRLMAIVVGKDGGTAGLVTVEDLLEEIVGDILDEYDVGEQDWHKVAENVWDVNAHLSLRRINRILGLRLPEKGDETLAGLILEHTESLPAKGQSVTVRKVRMTVSEIQGQRIERVRVARLEKDRGDAGGDVRAD